MLGVLFKRTDDVLSISILIITDEFAKDLAMYVGKLEKVLHGSDETKMIPIPRMGHLLGENIFLCRHFN
jgi:hypothetical protein